jgi:diacylglycerol diphosphate phosphatase/phosphatidate phosphatase
MHVFRPRADLFRGLVALTPLLGAVMIAISRCEDYRHDVYDVTVGSILGMAIGYFSYRRYYPRLRHPQCHEPFVSRATNADAGFAKIKNDEEIARRTGDDFVLGDIVSDEEDR